VSYPPLLVTFLFQISPLSGTCSPVANSTHCFFRPHCFIFQWFSPKRQAFRALCVVCSSPSPQSFVPGLTESSSFSQKVRVAFPTFFVPLKPLWRTMTLHSLTFWVFSHFFLQFFPHPFPFFPPLISIFQHFFWRLFFNFFPPPPTQWTPSPPLSLVLLLFTFLQLALSPFPPPLCSFELRPRINSCSRFCEPF